MEKYLSATPQATVLITILTAAFFINALVYLFRLVCSLIWREKKPRKYGGLWKLPYCMLLLLGIHPPRTFSYPMLGICLILWFFALACAIIQWSRRLPVAFSPGWTTTSPSMTISGVRPGTRRNNRNFTM